MKQVATFPSIIEFIKKAIMHIGSIESKPIALRPELVKVSGDVVVGVLLSQIWYWYQPNKQGKNKLQVMRDGFFWIAKTREEWMEETGLTLEQYKRALSVLKQKRFIEVRVMKFRGIAMSHLRLNRETVEAAVAGKVGIDTPEKIQPLKTPNDSGGVSPSNRVESKTPTGWCVSHQSYTETTAENTKQRFGVTAKPGETPEEKQVEQMKLNQILAAQKGKPPETITGHWQKHLGYLEEKCVKPLSAKEKGQLKQLSIKLGESTKPVIDLVFSDWGKFASLAKVKNGLETFPTSPHVGFLLKYYDVAMNYYLQSIAKVELPPAPKPKVVEVAKEAPHKLTDDEFQNMLDELK